LGVEAPGAAPGGVRMDCGWRPAALNLESSRLDLHPGKKKMSNEKSYEKSYDFISFDPFRLTITISILKYIS